MGRFLSECVLVPTTEENHGRTVFRLVEPLWYELGAIGSGWTAEVPTGFLTDFASVPRLFWRIFPPSGRYCKAAVVHDYLCDFAASGCPRWLADAVFLDAMTALGVPCWKRYCMYWAVRLYGLFSGRG